MTTRTKVHSGRTGNAAETSAQPVFILASERSGTNLLRRRLSEAQSDLFGPQPLHLLKHMYYSEPYYGDLSSEPNFEAFATACIGLAVHHFSPWNVELDPKQLWDWHQRHWQRRISAISVMHAMFSIHARRKGRDSYICKDNNLFDFASDIASNLPDAKYIYLYRDPRDTLVSQLGRPRQLSGAYELCVNWRSEQIRCIQAAHSLLMSGKQVLCLSYEDFVSQEAATLERICREFNLTRASDAEGGLYAEERSEIHEWKNLSKATTSDSVSQFRHKLNKTDIAIAEQVNWHQMLHLGYKPVSAERPQINKWTLRMVKMLDFCKKPVKIMLSRSMASDGSFERARYIRALGTRTYL